MVLLPVGRKPEVIDYIPSLQSPLGIQIFEELIKLKGTENEAKFGHIIRDMYEEYLFL